MKSKIVNLQYTPCSKRSPSPTVLRSLHCFWKPKACEANAIKIQIAVVHFHPPYLLRAIAKNDLIKITSRIWLSREIISLTLILSQGTTLVLLHTFQDWAPIMIFAIDSYKSYHRMEPVLRSPR